MAINWNTPAAPSTGGINWGSNSPTVAAPTPTPPQSFPDQIWSALSSGNPLSAAGSAISSGVQNIMNAPSDIASQFKEGAAQSKAGGTGAVDTLHKLGGIATAISAPLAPITKPIGQTIQAGSNAITDIPTVQKAALKLPNLDYGTGAQVAGDISNIAGTVAGGAEALKRAPGAVQSVKDSLPTPESQAEAAAAKAVAKQQALQQIAIKDATPAYNKNMIGEKAVNGVPRVQEGGGVTKVRTITPTPSEIAAGKQLANVPGYATAKTALEKYNVIEPEIASRGQALDTSLENEKVLRPPQEVKSIVQTAVNDAAENSVLLQKADPAVTNYLRVVGRAIDQNPGTLAGENMVRRALDNAYEDAGGKYGNNKALDQIHRAARNALTDDIEAKATNTEVKASLKEMSNLYKAADVLQDKARAEGGSKLEQLMKANPVTTKVIQTGVKATGLGAVLHLVP